MYVGVSDDGDIEGVSRELYRSKRGNVDIESLRGAYATAMRKFINEGITPTPNVDIEWIEHAGLFVLRVATTITASAPHHIVEDGHFFVRRGGTCRRGLSESFINRRSS